MGIVERFTSLLQIYTQFIQYVGIVSSVRVPWPASWNSILQFASYLKFDFTINFPDINVPAVDSRAQYVFLSNIVPLVLAILLLVFFKSFNVVLWYVLLLASIGLLIAGTVTKFLLSSSSTQSSVMSDSFIIAGGVGTGLMILTFLIVWCMESRKRAKVHAMKERQRKKAEMEARGEYESDDDNSSASFHNPDDENEPDEDDGQYDSQPNLENIVKNRYKQKPFWTQFRNFFLGSIFVFVAILLLNIVPLQTIFGPNTPDDFLALQKKSGDIGFGVGIALFVIGSLLLLNFLFNTFGLGRRILTDLNNIWKMNVLMIVLLVLTLSYIPITSSILTMWNCEKKTCDFGKRFYVELPSMSISDIGSSFLKSNASSEYCSTCSFIGECSIYSLLCPITNDLRMVEDPRFSCSNEIYIFYAPGAALMFLSFTLGVPILFYRIISTSIKFLDQIPIMTRDADARWILAVSYTNNSCKGLYGMFDYAWRYYNLILLLQKLLVVCIYIFSRNVPIVLASCLGLVQTVFATMAIKSQPYINRIEDLTATVCCMITASNAIIAFLVAFHGYDPKFFPFVFPDWVIIPISIVNGVVPVFVTSVASIYAFVKGDSSVNKLKRAELELLEQKAREDLNIAKRVRKSASLEASGELVEETLSDDESEEHDLKAKVKSEEKSIRKITSAVDAELNKTNLKNIVNFFLFLGFSGFLSLSLVICGFLLKSQAGNYSVATNSGSFKTEKTVKHFEFVGYSDWDEFVENCCCSDYSHNGIDYELWTCLKSSSSSSSGPSLSQNRYKIRQRTSADGSLNGTEIRPFCSKLFNPSLICSKPAYDPDFNSSYFSVDPCNGVELETEMLTYLW